MFGFAVAPLGDRTGETQVKKCNLIYCHFVISRLGIDSSSRLSWSPGLAKRANLEASRGYF